MIAAVFSGWMIFESIAKIEEAYYHRGSVMVESEEGGPRWRQSEAAYKRGEYSMGVFMLILGLYLWYCVAKGLQNSKATKE
jgi:hypothetical protein